MRLYVDSVRKSSQFYFRKLSLFGFHHNGKGEERRDLRQRGGLVLVVLISGFIVLLVRPFHVFLLQMDWQEGRKKEKKEVQSPVRYIFNLTNREPKLRPAFGKSRAREEW